MGKRKNPETSLEAYKYLGPEKVTEMHRKIMCALINIGEGNYELIAKHLELPEEKVWKRIGEACKAGIIYKTERTMLTKNNRRSFIYTAVPTTEPIKKKERVMRGKTVADFSRAINQVQLSTTLQSSLF